MTMTTTTTANRVRLPIPKAIRVRTATALTVTATTKYLIRDRLRPRVGGAAAGAGAVPHAATRPPQPHRARSTSEGMHPNTDGFVGPVGMHPDTNNATRIHADRRNGTPDVTSNTFWISVASDTAFGCTP